MQRATPAYCLLVEWKIENNLHITFCAIRPFAKSYIVPWYCSFVIVCCCCCCWCCYYNNYYFFFRNGRKSNQHATRHYRSHQVLVTREKWKRKSSDRFVLSQSLRFQRNQNIKLYELVRHTCVIVEYYFGFKLQPLKNPTAFFRARREQIIILKTVVPL